MNDRKNRIECLCTIVAVLSLGWMLLAFGEPGWLGNELLLIVMYGTLLGQSALAAVWVALGPFSFARRVSLAAIWLVGIVMAIGFNGFVRSELVHDFDVVSTLALVVLGQATLIAVPSWIVATWYGLRLMGSDELESSFKRHDRQVGIREVMIITAVVAIFFGGARFSAGDLGESRINWEAMQVQGSIMLASSVLALAPMILIRRSWLLPGTVAGLLLVFLNAAEILLVRIALQRFGVPDGFYWPILLLNLTQSVWIISVLSLLKLGGYRLVSSP